MKWNDLKYGKKIGIGFGLVLLLFVAATLVSYSRFNDVNLLSGKVSEANHDHSFALAKEIDHLNWMATLSNLFLDKEVTEVTVQTDDHKCGFGQWIYGEEMNTKMQDDPELATLVENIKDPHKRLHESAIKIDNTYVDFDPDLLDLLAARWIDHLNWNKALANSLLTESSFKGGVDPHKCAFGQWFYSYKPNNPEFAALLQKWEKPHSALHETAKKIVEAQADSDYKRGQEIYQNETLVTLENLGGIYQETADWGNSALSRQLEAKKIFDTDTQNSLADTRNLLAQIRTHLDKTADNNNKYMAAGIVNAKILVTGMSISAIIIAIFISFVISNGLTKPLAKGVAFAQSVANGDFSEQIDINRKDEIGELITALNDMSFNLNDVMGGIKIAAEQVSASSEELSSTSENLSSSATEQAANLEETSASIEELTASVQQNAKSSGEASKIASEASSAAQEGGAAVTETVTAMKRITEQIKIVDDIADQTNLLALNAAIEAARAGEMGKGFAVVAVEVRKLAERSQLAAREISELAKNSVGRAEEAGELIGKVVPDIKKTAELVEGITTSSMEQASGADQISAAIIQLNEVTQQNSSMSEETSAAAEELAAQAQSMQVMISKFKLNSSQTAHGQLTGTTPGPILGLKPVDENVFESAGS